MTMFGLVPSPGLDLSFGPPGCDRDARISFHRGRLPAARARPRGTRRAGRLPRWQASVAAQSSRAGGSRLTCRIRAVRRSRSAQPQRAACRRSETAKSYPSSSPVAIRRRCSRASLRAVGSALPRAAMISTSGSSSSSGNSPSSFCAFSRVVMPRILPPPPAISPFGEPGRGDRPGSARRPPCWEAIRSPCAPPGSALQGVPLYGVNGVRTRGRARLVPPASGPKDRAVPGRGASRPVRVCHSGCGRTPATAKETA